MSTLAPTNLMEFCEKHDLYEYGCSYVITMPDGFKFVTRSPEIADSFRHGADTGANVETITELGE